MHFLPILVHVILVFTQWREKKVAPICSATAFATSSINPTFTQPLPSRLLCIDTPPTRSALTLLVTPPPSTLSGVLLILASKKHCWRVPSFTFGKRVDDGAAPTIYSQLCHSRLDSTFSCAFLTFPSISNHTSTACSPSLIVVKPLHSSKTCSGSSTSTSS